MKIADKWDAEVTAAQEALRELLNIGDVVIDYADEQQKRLDKCIEIIGVYFAQYGHWPISEISYKAVREWRSQSSALCPSCLEPLNYPSGDGCAAMNKHKEPRND